MVMQSTDEIICYSTKPQTAWTIANSAHL